MSVEKPSERGVFDPTYWEGFDLQTGQGDLRDRKMLKLIFRQHNKLVPILRSAIEEVLRGNHTEIRYGSGKEFNPEAEGIHDGSVVVMDSEKLTTRSHKVQDVESEPPITEPYVGYWLDNQPSTSNTGLEIEADDDTGLTYRRELTWGVLTTIPVYDYTKQSVSVADRRVIQPISFAQVSYDGKRIKIPKFIDLKPWHDALVLPEVIGRAEKTDQRKLDSENEVLSIGRIRSIDLVHLAKAGRKRRFSPTIGRLAVPKISGA